MTRYGISIIAQALSVGLLFLCLSFSAGQDIPVTPTVENTPDSEPLEPLTVKVSVNEVILDVVALDRKGYPVTDLIATDFVVYQDGKRQEVVSSFYIDSQSGIALPSAADRKNAPNLKLLPVQTLKKEEVRRTIVFLLDNYSFNYEDIYYSRMALRNFVEKQMQPGDIVAFFRTDYGNLTLNKFLSDKREVLAQINAFYPLPSTMYDGYFINDMDEEILKYETLLRGRIKHGNRMSIAENLLLHLSYSVRALENMPGRKIINTLTTIALIDSNQDKTLKLKDEALRAGVAINVLNMKGLYVPLSYGADASQPNRAGLIMSDDRKFLDIMSQIPDSTGGVYIKDRNFFLDGLGRETESMMRGYYLITYATPPDTFEKRRGKEDVYRRVKVNVKRSGIMIHTRDGFFGRLESKTKNDIAVDNVRDPLTEAILSPFKQDGININISAGYVKNAEGGYLVRSWIHLNSDDIKIVETDDVGGRISLEALCLISDVNGNVGYQRKVEFTESNINMDWIKRHGIRFSMLLPVKKSGPYYVRISIRDAESGITGAAYQFLEIPDIGRKGLALSDIFIITSASDLQWMNSKDTSQWLFFPVFQEEEIRSPALRTYKPGDNLLTLTMLYNTDARAIDRSEIETQTILYKDGREFLRGVSSPITIEKVEDPGSIPLVNGFTVGTNMTPGYYVLQIRVTDKKNRNKDEGAASQFIGFTVTK